MHICTIRTLLSLTLLAASAASAGEAWTSWLACKFDDWPLTSSAEPGTFEVGRAATLLGLWKPIGASPFPRITADPSGRDGRSAMLTRYMGTPALTVVRTPRIRRGRVEIECRVYFRDRIDTSLYLVAVDAGNGRRDAGAMVCFGAGKVRCHKAGQWQDAAGSVRPNAWTRVRLALDLDRGAYAVFVGGQAKPVAEGVPMSASYRPNMVHFGCAEAAGRAWLDDVTVRATEPPAAAAQPHEPLPVRQAARRPADTALPKIFHPSNPTFPVPTQRELDNGLAQWARAKPGLLTVEALGTSRKGRPIHLCCVTDREVGADHKQRVLITTSHGPERNATVLALALTRWLLGDDPLAARTRHGQEIYVMPCNDPDGYAAQADSERFVEDLAWDGLRRPSAFPAGAAFVRALGTVQPEVHVDVRSTDDAAGAMLAESFGVDFDSATARAHARAIPHLMCLAAERAGFSCLAGEAGDGKIRATAPVSGLADHHYYQRCHRIVAPSLSYYRCHALSFTVHAAFQESFLAAMQCLFAAGHRDKLWRMERCPGYPVNHLGLVLTGGFGAWGPTAAARRRSRAELWSKIDQISLAEPSYGTVGGRALVFSSDPDQMQRLMSRGIHLPNGAHLVPWDKFIEGLRAEPDAARFDIEPMHRMVCERHRASVGMYYRMAQGRVQPNDAAGRHGLALQIYMPFPDAEVTEIRLDGHPLAESPTDGYVVYHNPGTAVEVSIPPGRVQRLHVVTLRYDPKRTRREGFAEEDWRLD